jgi:hypothetical protein
MPIQGSVEVMVDVSVFSIVIAAASVTVAAVFAIFQLRNLVKARRMDLVMRLYLGWGEAEMKKSFSRVMAEEITSYEEFTKKYGLWAAPEHPQIWTDVDRICWFVNGYGYLVYSGLADKKYIEDLFGHGVIMGWEKVSPLVEGVRKDLNSPKSWQWFEYLYNEIKTRP